MLKNICKQFDKQTILHNISFHIGANESVGLIGLNGAGKTTLLNLIAGILKPNSGFIRVNGAETLIQDYRKLRELLYISGTKSQLWEDLQIKDSFTHCIHMYRLEENQARQRLQELCALFQIEALLHQFPNAISLGERMRCELVYGLLPEPKILLLDEAMIGIDVATKQNIIEYLKLYKSKQKITMLATSHNLLEVESLCERIILLDHSNIIFDGSMRRILKDFSPIYRMELQGIQELPDFEDLPLEKYIIENNRITIYYDKQKIETEQILQQVMERTNVEQVILHEPNLERTIQKIAGQDFTNGAG